MKFLALDVALVNNDGYWTRASDYSIYQDEKGRFHVIPHDMNEGLTDEGGRGFGRAAGIPALVVRRMDLLRLVALAVLVDGGRRRARDVRRASADLDPLVGLNDTTKPLRSKLLAVPALRQRYLSYVREIAEK